MKLLFNCKNREIAESKPSDTYKEIKPLLAPGEKIEKSYLCVDDTLVFTNRRFIRIPTTIPPSTIREIDSMPYRSITRFSMDLNSPSEESPILQLWIAGVPTSFEIPLDSATAPELHRTLSDYVLNRHSPWLYAQMAQKNKKRVRSILAGGVAGVALIAALSYHKVSHKQEPAGKHEILARLAKQLLKKHTHR